MAKYTINDTTLTAIADAIRKKSGTTGGIDPADMAALIEAIESGAGSATLWDRPYTSGSFTLAEDTSATYEIGDFSDWLKYTSYDGSTVTANYNIVAFLWRDVSAQTSMNSTLYCGACQAIYYNGGLGNTAGSCGLGRSASDWSSIKNGGIYANNGILEARFKTTYLGYAGDTYHWLVTKVKV